MGDVIAIDGGKSLMMALKKMPGMEPFDSNEEAYIKELSAECREKGMDLKVVAEGARQVINEYRHKKLLQKMKSIPTVSGREAAVGENLRRRGLVD